MQVTATPAGQRSLSDDPAAGRSTLVVHENRATTSAPQCRRPTWQSTASDRAPERPSPLGARPTAFGEAHLNSLLGFPVQNVTLQSPSERSWLLGTYAGYLFRGRLVKIRANATVGNLLRSYMTESGLRFDLLVTKLQTTKEVVGGGASVNRMNVKVMYVLVSGPGIEPLDLQAYLDKLAAFGFPSPKKAASRLELLCSTARKSTRKGQDFLILDNVTSNDFEMIQEAANEGRGFCPPHFVRNWLGNHAVGRRTFALQVRIFASNLGIARGVLMIRPDINKIQLRPSMLKVGLSLSRSDQGSLSDRAVVLVTSNGVYPFPAHLFTARIPYGDTDPPKSYTSNKLSTMMVSLLESLRVPRPLVHAYGEEFREERGKKLKHTSLIGLVNPTFGIPSGHVFVTGILDNNEFGCQEFVTRFPCTEVSDVTTWRLVREKAGEMTSSDWQYLQDLKFWEIIFGSPLPGQLPMPKIFADGALDGA